MSDILSKPESALIHTDAISRWHASWNVVTQSVESGGVNLRAVSKIFLTSVFQPDALPNSNSYAPTVDRTLVGQLESPGVNSQIRPSTQVLEQAENTLIHNLLDVKPPVVQGAMETIDELSKMGDFSFWTVGDYMQTTHKLPNELFPQDRPIDGTGHQFWKLWKLGLTNNPDIDIRVSDDKLSDVVPRIHELEGRGIDTFIFLDDDLSNITGVRGRIDQENVQREMMGEDPIRYNLIHVNQGRKRIFPSPELSMQGSLGTFHSIDAFTEAPQQIRALVGDTGAPVGIFCDFDGVVTDNVAVRKEWDTIVTDVVVDVRNRTVENPQKEKRGGNVLTHKDIVLSGVLPYIEECRRRGLRIGVKNGAYDLLTPGHIGGFDDATGSCDVLIVLLNSDASIQQYKGVKEHIPRPINSELNRADLLLGLDVVHGVVVFDEESPIETIKAIRPDVYITSREYEGSTLPEFEEARNLGVEIIYTDIREGLSTSSTTRTIVEGFLTEAAKEGDEATQKAVDILKKYAGYS